MSPGGTGSRTARVAWVLLLLCMACQPQFNDGTWVASVDGAEISLGELRTHLKDAAELYPDERREDVLNEVLNRLVSDQVILNRAKEAGVEVLDEEIDARLRRLHGSEVGTIDRTYREEVRRQMTIDRTVLFDLADRVNVTESAMAVYFEEHRDRYSVPERVQIRQIVVPERARAEELRERVRRGADFAEVAAEHSLAPEASEGGLLPPFAEGELPEAFDRAFELKKGLSPVIESPYGFHVFQLEKRLKPRRLELHEVREQIELELESQRLEELRREWLRGLRREADIRVNDELLETLR